MSNPFSQEEILKIIEQAGHPLRLDDILSRAEVSRRSKKEILGVLKDFIKEGKVLRLSGGRYAMPQVSSYTLGTLSIQRSGVGFVSPQDKQSPAMRDIFISPSDLGDAWNGDTVEVLLLSKKSTGRDRSASSGRRSEGRIIQVINRKHTDITVQVKEVRPYYIKGKKFEHTALASPTDPRLNFRILVDISALAENSVTQGDILFVHVEKRISTVSKKTIRNDIRPLWEASALEHMGRYTHVKLQEDMTKLSHDIPTFFPDDVLDEARKIAQEYGFISDENEQDSLQGSHTKATKAIKEISNVDLRDVRSMPLVTIDGADAKDFDDAIFVEKDENLWRLVVAIADVSHFVKSGSKMDTEAQKRANSYYFPSSVEPMLPQEISNGLCSLRPDEEHRVMLAEMYFNAKGICERSNFSQGIMCSHARLTYDQVQAFYDNYDHKNIDQKNADQLSPALNNMLLEARELAHVLIERRKKDGGLHLEIPEPSCTIINDSITEMLPRTHCFSHELIEAFMVAANEAVATLLSSKKIPCLYRVHPAPDPDRIQNLFTTLRHTNLVSRLPYPKKNEQEKWITTLLHALDEDKEASALQDEHAEEHAKEHAKNTGEFSLIQRMIVRSMMQARYSPELDRHFGLASSAYSHFTSPIRRYADLEVHRALKIALGLEKNKISLEYLTNIAEICNTRERVAQAAEREVYRRMACLYLEDSIDKTFSGIISHVTSFGLFVELSPSMAEGFIPISDLGQDYFVFNEEEHSIAGTRSNAIFRLGANLDVILRSVSVEHLEIKLEPLGLLNPVNSGKTTRKKTSSRTPPTKKSKDKISSETKPKKKR